MGESLGLVRLRLARKLHPLVYTYVLNEIFFSKNRVSSRLLFKIRASLGYTYVLKGIFIDFFIAYLAIGTVGQLGPSGNWGIGIFGQLGPLDNWR